MAGLAAHTDPDPGQSLATVTHLRRGPVSEQSDDDHRAAALWWQDIYRQMGRRLDDAATAEVHRIVLAGMSFLIDGAEENGYDRATLQAMRTLILEAVKAPDQL
ncbi:hypothetical protein ABTX81_30325 [Kitasatospora sp. NPDC097605]|uniref:hypothetical protein n=1 Tax=Kitasatospora sp. NPDC097605 TaxID=3157226 RepID=UPI0033310EBF